MPYAIIDLAEGNRVALVSGTKYPFPGIEEEWLEPGDEDLPLPAGWPKDSHPIFLFDQEAEKIISAMAQGKAVLINERGWVDINQGEERFQLKQFQVETVFLGLALDHLSYTGGEIPRKKYLEQRHLRDLQIDRIMAE